MVIPDRVLRVSAGPKPLPPEVVEDYKASAAERASRHSHSSIHSADEHLERFSNLSENSLFDENRKSLLSIDESKLIGY